MRGKKQTKRDRRQMFYGMMYILPSFLVIMTFCVVTHLAVVFGYHDILCCDNFYDDFLQLYRV